MSEINLKKRVNNIIEILSKTYPDAKCELNFTNPLELLVAVQLSAQCTDKLVNIVTKKLFKKYKIYEDYSNSDINEFSFDINRINYYKNKAKNIKNACTKIILEHDKKIPNNMDELLKIPGVGRKTANLLLSVLYNEQTIVVDTHVRRLSNRLKLVNEKDPTKIELKLKEIVPKKFRNQFSSQIIFHGRRCCTAINPNCKNCPLFYECNDIN